MSETELPPSTQAEVEKGKIKAARMKVHENEISDAVKSAKAALKQSIEKAKNIQSQMEDPSQQDGLPFELVQEFAFNKKIKDTYNAKFKDKTFPPIAEDGSENMNVVFKRTYESLIVKSDNKIKKLLVKYGSAALV